MRDGARGSAAWRVALLTVAVFSAALVLLVLGGKTVLGWNGDAGWTLVPAGAPFTVEVASVTAGGPAARAGVRAGDRIDVRRLARDDRIFVLTTPLAGRPIALTVERGGATRAAVIVAERTRFDAFNVAAYVVLLWIAAFAALIAWRRPALPEARLLSLALSAYVAADVLQYLAVPAADVDAALSALNAGGILGAVTAVLFVKFTERFGRPLGTSRRVLNAIAYAGAAVLAVFGVSGAVAQAYPVFDPVPVSLGTGAAALVCSVQMLVIFAGAGAVAMSRGAERQRAAWALASFGVLFLAAVVQIVLDTLVPTTDMAVATQAAVNVVAIAAPVGLTYSVLSRRLLDIGFALNQAAVFSAVSLIVVGAFIVVEWALGNWLQNIVGSTILSLALAIGVGFSIKALHERVEHAMDRVFFRKRYAQEKALLRFAHEAPYVTDADTLVRRTVDEIRTHVEASAAAIYRPVAGAFVAVPAADGLPASVEENDPALVAMRASKTVVDLHRTQSELRGEYAFPMMARGRLIAVLACAAKRDGDPYAPDEIATLAQVAREVASALDVHAAHGDGGTELVALQLEVSSLRDEVRALTDALRATERT